MNTKINGDNAIRIINSGMYLTSSKILAINISENNQVLEIHVLFNILYPTDKIIRLVFTGVTEFALWHQDESASLPYVVNYKLFKLENGRIYLCLDPYDNENVVNEKDNAFLIAKDITLEYE